MLRVDLVLGHRGVRRVAERGAPVAIRNHARTETLGIVAHSAWHGCC